jgi:hypothetical protein
VKACAKLSAKKLKYLKKPRKPIFTRILTNKSNLLFILVSAFARESPTK